jgi:hypothetical protein
VTRLHSRPRKLEAASIDDKGLISRLPHWLEYRMRQMERMFGGEKLAERIPLAMAGKTYADDELRLRVATSNENATHTKNQLGSTSFMLHCRGDPFLVVQFLPLSIHFYPFRQSASR